MKIKTNERIFIVGQTGSGKSYLLNYLLRFYHKFVLLNLKPNEDFIRESSENKIFFTPKSFTNLNEVVDLILLDIYEKGNNTVIYDEFVYKRDPYVLSEAEHLIIRLGRQRGIGVIITTQKPSKIPSEVYDQAQHFFIFKLLHKPDRNKFGELFGKKLVEHIKNLNKYEFIYVNIYEQKPKKMILRNDKLIVLENLEL